VVETALRGRGYRVVVTSTGTAGIEAGWRERPDVVILDLGLPDVDGIDVCRTLRTWYANTEPGVGYRLVAPPDQA
jgi:DNA-binding response OmpR family regulator